MAAGDPLQYSSNFSFCTLRRCDICSREELNVVRCAALYLVFHVFGVPLFGGPNCEGLSEPSLFVAGTAYGWCFSLPHGLNWRRGVLLLLFAYASVGCLRKRKGDMLLLVFATSKNPRSNLGVSSELVQLLTGFPTFTFPDTSSWVSCSFPDTGTVLAHCTSGPRHSSCCKDWIWENFGFLASWLYSSKTTSQ